MRILEYSPQYSMIQAFKVNFNDESLIEAKPDFATYLANKQLTFDNFCMVMSTLLTIEDISKMHVYSQLEETNRRVQQIIENETVMYKIMISQTKVNAKDELTEDIDEIVLVSPESCLSSIRPKHKILEQLKHIDEKNEKLRIVGVIKKITRNSVTFSCKGIPNLNIAYKVIFRSTRFPIRLMFYKLVYLKASPNIRHYLFPCPNNQMKYLETSNSTAASAPISNSLKLLNKSIATNADQLQAVKQILDGPSTLAPYIVFGPPGTGKTTTIVEAILQVYLQRKTRIIVTASSNNACDTIALRICECIEKNEQFTYEREQPNKILLRLFSEKIPKKELKLLHPLLLRNSNYIQIINEQLSSDKCKIKKTKTARAIYEDYLKAHLIIVATLCKVGTISNILNGLGVTHIFIDEAAASSEVESLMGFVGIKKRNCHVILSGDHKQLGPVIKSQRASCLGLSQSIMERLMASELYRVKNDGSYDSTLQTRLRQNYRSHPEIVGLFNKLYYNDELIPSAPLERVNQAANWDMLTNAQFPIVFQSTFGKTERPPLSLSSYNELEANVVCWYVWILLKKGLGNGSKVKPEDIGVITPYLAQCALLKRKLFQRGQKKVRVGTVESFQGLEKPIIIVSFVCSFTNLQFLADPRRLNVLLSRPMSLLILIGNSHSLSQSQDLKYIIDQCKFHGHYLDKKADRKKLKDMQKNVKCDKLNDRMANLSLVNPTIAEV